MLSPLLAVVAALIRLDSKGSPLHGSEREGKDGRAFTCWKFRTMVTNAHAIQHQLTEAALDGPHFKMERPARHSSRTLAAQDQHRRTAPAL